jgi:sec-independent protein translocase protein TatB
MFDIGIMELGLIAVVALLVIGPERLPAVARTVGFWFGKMRKFVSSVQEDFNREVVKSEELKRLVEEQAKIKDVHEIIEQTIDESRKTVSTGAKITTEQKAPEQKETPRLDSQDVQPQNNTQPAEPATKKEQSKTNNVE